MRIVALWLIALLGMAPTPSSVALASSKNNFARHPSQQHYHHQKLQQQNHRISPFKASFIPHGGAATKSTSSRSKTGSSGGGSTSTQAFAASAAGIDSAMQTAMEEKRPLRVLFLSADTGGGHRASAEALAKQFLIQYPGSSYELVDVWTDHGILPYRALVPAYKWMSAHPNYWRFFYHVSNTKLNEMYSNFHSKLTCGGRIKKRLESLDPDVIVSVHPTMNHTPLIEARRIAKQRGKHIPFFTVVTDLGSGHCMWFERGVNKLYVASDRLYQLARRRGGTSPNHIVRTGLPIRHGFAVQAEQLGDRTTPAGKEYQRKMRIELGMDGEKPMILVMGGGEGVGSLSDIVNEMYAELSRAGVDATLCVVCGRNEKLQKELFTRDFDAVATDIQAKNAKSQGGGRRRGFLRRIFRRRRRNDDAEKDTAVSTTTATTPGKVDVLPLGFVTKVPEYMVAADVLVSKAGPGTIAEAASVGLPVMMTSFLPGQEAGNVDVVLESGFGEFQKKPAKIADVVTSWLQDEDLMANMVRAAINAGNPYAADEIVADIGKETVAWMHANEA